MKRLVFVLAVVALILASCSVAGKAKPKLGLAMHSFDDPESVAIRRFIETAALDKADLSIIDGQNQQSTQDKQIDSFFERKIGALAIDPVDGNAVSSLIGKAKERRIPIVFFDRKPSDESMRSWDKLFFVGTREAEAGAAQGEMLAAFWNTEPSADRNKDGTLQFVALDGDRGGPDSALLAENCVKSLGAVGIKSERLASESNGKSARERTAALIARYGDRIEAVICGDNISALGAIEAFKAAGYFKRGRHIPIVGLGEGDITSAVSDAILSGSLLGAAFADAGSQGKAVFDLAYSLAKGADPTKAGWRITDAKYVWIPYKEYSIWLPRHLKIRPSSIRK
jgi:methyl-galactoside transport system substrate-binding protein